MPLSDLVKYPTVEEQFQCLKEVKQGSAKNVSLLHFYFYFENFGAVFMIDLEGATATGS